MKCKVFEHHLPDWIGDRLPFSLAQQMQAHQASCPVCQQTAAQERALRARWQDLPTPNVNSALWSRLAQRIETAQPQRPRRLFPAWAMGSAMATAVIICGMLWTHTPVTTLGSNDPTSSSVAHPVDEHHIVQMVSEVQQLSDAESDNFMAVTTQDRQTTLKLLQSKEGN